MEGKGWILVIGLITLLGHWLPYTLLSNVNAWHGSFLLWLVLDVVLILIAMIITRNFEDS